MATPEMNYRMTVKDLQQVLVRLPDSARITVTIPAGFAADSHYDTPFDLHVTSTDPRLDFALHAFTKNGPEVDVHGNERGETSETPTPLMNVAEPEPPSKYSEWRSDANARDEDAAYWFGYYLMTKCRAPAMASAGPDISEKERANIAVAVDTALNGAMDLLEGYWRIEVGENMTESFRLLADIADDDGRVVETIQIAPCDLQIGYWKWRDGGFR